MLGENMKSIFTRRSSMTIGAGMRARVQDDFAMGIALKQFMVVSINPTEETAKPSTSKPPWAPSAIWTPI